MNPDLEKWIDEASKGLEPLAREKITEQITEHYQDAIVKYRARGLDDVEMHVAAMNDLGDSKKALREYSRIFFSDDYLANIKKMNVVFMLMLISIAIAFSGTYSTISYALDVSGRSIDDMRDPESFSFVLKYLSTSKLIMGFLQVIAILLGVIHLKYMYLSVKYNNFGKKYIKASMLGYFVMALGQCSMELYVIDTISGFQFWFCFVSFALSPLMTIPIMQRYIKQREFFAKLKKL